MSIIEKALGKQRAAASPDPVGDAQNDAARAASRPRLPRDLIISVADQAKLRRQPTQSIVLDMDRLRAEGLLPPADLADRMKEQIRRIKRPLLEAALGRTSGAETSAPANVVMVSSSVAAEGKTYVSFNVALGIAREKDFSAKRHLSAVLGAEDRAGLTDVIADESLDPEDLVLGTDIPGLLFLPAGRRSSIAPELFASHRMAQIVSRLGQADRQRIILFDSSPLLATNESSVLARIVDQVLLVVRAEETPQAAVLEAVALLDKTKMIRCVLNQSRVSTLTEHYYGYGYYPHDRPKAP